jgi:hypothetical protein
MSCARVPGADRAATTADVLGPPGFGDVREMHARRGVGSVSRLPSGRGIPLSPVVPGRIMREYEGSLAPWEGRALAPRQVKQPRCSERLLRHMAENGRYCVESGRPLKNFSGLTVDGGAYHAHCWERTRQARSTVSSRDQARSSAFKRGKAT